VPTVSSVGNGQFDNRGAGNFFTVNMGPGSEIPEYRSTFCTLAMTTEDRNNMEEIPTREEWTKSENVEPRRQLKYNSAQRGTEIDMAVPWLGQNGIKNKTKKCA